MSFLINWRSLLLACILITGVSVSFAGPNSKNGQAPPPVPDPVPLVSPANNATNQSLTPVLVWNTVPTATGYMLVVATDAGFTNVVFDSGIQPDTSYTFLAPLNNYTLYYWKVRATDGVDTGAYSSTNDFRTLLALPVLATPNNGAVQQSVTPQLIWGSVTGATSYTLQIATDAGFTANLQTISGITDTSYTFGTNLENYTVYYWRVRATDGTDVTAYTSAFDFRTVLSVPALAAPANLATAQALLPTLNWNSVTTATDYQLQVATDAGFSTIVHDAGFSADTFYTFGANLNNYTQYYWRVRARNVTDTGAYSATRSFTTIISTPVLAVPANGVVNQSLTPQLRWYSVPGASSYTFQLASDAGFTSIVETAGGVTDTFRTIVGPLNYSTTYYWRVNATDGSFTTAYPTAFSFTTQMQVPVLVSPANAVTNQSLTPTLVWNAVAGANGYELLVAGDAGFSSIVYNSGFIPDTSYTFVASLTNYTQYYWKVRAKNTTDTTNYSVARSFRTLLSTPALAAPSNGAVFQSLTPQLRWNPVTGASSYTVLFATNAAFTTNLQTFSSITDTFYTFGSNLNNYTVYYWKVSATDGTDTTVYSGTRNFRTLISTPVQASPADGAIVVPVLTNFKWFAVTGATSYRVQVATDAGFTNIVVNTGGITDTSHTLGTQLESYTNYFWRVRASEGANNTVYTGGWAFQTAIASPVTVFPADLASGITIHPTLIWRSVNGATKYQVQFSKNLAFTQILYDSVTVDTTLRIDSILANSTMYYWRVNASNPNDTAPYVSRSFTTIEELIPLLNHPTGGQLVYSLSPVAYWNITVSSTGITYDVQYCRDSLFQLWTTGTIDAGANIYDTIPNLAPATTYYWRVRTKNSGGVISYSAFSSFVTYGSVTTLPTASYPLTGTTVYSLNPTLYWYLGVTSYGYTFDVRYKLSSSGTWGAPVSVGSSLSYALAGLVNGESYDWQVRCMNGVDTSAWSSTQTFTTYPVTAPSAPSPVISYPNAGVTVYSLAPMLFWYISESGLGVTYDVELRTDTNFTGTPTVAGLANLYYQSSGLSAGTTYYFKVRSFNGSSHSAWSAYESFVTFGGTGSIVPVLTYPTDSAMVYATSAALYWYTTSAASAIVSYQVQVATDTNFAVAAVNTTNTYYTATGLVPGTTYYWRVRSYNGTSYSAYSAPESFAIVGNAGSLTPILSWPIGGATQPDTTSLYWYINGWSPTISYQIQYGTAIDFTGASTTTSVTSSVQVSGLTPGVTYYWRVRTFNGAVYSAYSAVESFSVEAGSAPVRMMGGSPVANVVVPSARIQFSWYAPVASAPQSYELQYSSVPDFSAGVTTVGNLSAPRHSVSGLAANVPVYWRVRSQNMNGMYSMYSQVERFIPATPTNVPEDVLPTEYSLKQNYPNPFNPSTAIQYSVIKQGTVTVEVYNILGVKVSTLVNEVKAPGTYTINFNARGLASGTYFYRINAGGFTAVRKMQLLK